MHTSTVHRTPGELMLAEIREQPDVPKVRHGNRDGQGSGHE